MFRLLEMRLSIVEMVTYRGTPLVVARRGVTPAIRYARHGAGTKFGPVEPKNNFPEALLHSLSLLSLSHGSFSSYGPSFRFYEGES